MKKFTKIMLIIAGVIATIGLVCVVVAFGMGLKTSTLLRMVQNGYFSFDEDDLNFEIDSLGEIFSTESSSGSNSSHEVKESFKDLDIEFGAGTLEVRYADVANVQVEENGIKNLKVDVRENTLVIRDNTNININVGVDELSDRRLVVLIPNGMQFGEVEIEIGASTADISDILADEISITVGAGEVNIALNGVQEDYNYSVECGVGTVVIGESSYSGLGTEKHVKYDGATKRIEVECGIGAVKVKFQK